MSQPIFEPEDRMSEEDLLQLVKGNPSEDEVQATRQFHGLFCNLETLSHIVQWDNHLVVMAHQRARGNPMNHSLDNYRLS